MPAKNIVKNFVSLLLKRFLSVEERRDKEIGSPKKILLVRQHNQFGDMLASVSLFRALKEKFPYTKIVLLASPENFFAVSKNPFIDELFVFEKKNLFKLSYLKELYKALRSGYDLAIVPATVAISATSCLLAGLSDAKIKIGIKSLNGKENRFAYLFHHRIDLDWRKCPDAHVSDFILDIVRPFGIKTINFSTSITFDEIDRQSASDFIRQFKKDEKNKLVGLHVGAGKPQNRWAIEKFEELLIKMKNENDFCFYFTGGKMDNEQIDYIQKIFGRSAGYFLDRTIPELAALISMSDLFITNDTGVMHVAGATAKPQISIFGPTNPFNWAPIGENKFFIRKSERIDDVTVDDLLELVRFIFKR